MDESSKGLYWWDIAWFRGVHGRIRWSESGEGVGDMPGWICKDVHGFLMMMMMMMMMMVVEAQNC
jgi:hypothetical protein